MIPEPLPPREASDTDRDCRPGNQTHMNGGGLVYDPDQDNSYEKTLP
ncbi:hypothetical protein ACFWFF_36925 [Streptomyces sp. NPDC060223]